MKKELKAKVIDQIKLDLKFDYIECLEELLEKVPEEDLKKFINESLPRSEKSIIDIRLDNILSKLKLKRKND